MFICNLFFFFFFNDTATTEIYTLSLHDALPICRVVDDGVPVLALQLVELAGVAVSPELDDGLRQLGLAAAAVERSEEHTSELQSRQYLVCRLLLEKKKKKSNI